MRQETETEQRHNIVLREQPLASDLNPYTILIRFLAGFGVRKPGFTSGVSTYLLDLIFITCKMRSFVLSSLES